MKNFIKIFIVNFNISTNFQFVFVLTGLTSEENFLKLFSGQTRSFNTSGSRSELLSKLVIEVIFVRLLVLFS